ncbi:hypothetical protein, partial [Bacillus haynesii]|uniref:hypothetical protein n=1 Tax=Bacillus haynesii TaxID=1925021 RepID=UPI001969A61C
IMKSNSSILNIASPVQHLQKEIAKYQNIQQMALKQSYPSQKAVKLNLREMFRLILLINQGK